MAPRHRKNSRRYQPQRYISPKTRRTVALCAFGVLLLGGVIWGFASGKIRLPQSAEKPAETMATEPAEDQVIHIVAGGDVNISDKVIASGGTEYDYTDMLADVMPVLANGDLTLLNFEGNVDTENYGSALHTAPVQLLTALKRAGVDILQTANSQSITNGLRGLTETATAIRAAGMQPLGTYADTAEFEQYQGFLIYQVQGIRIALVAFTKGMDGRNLPEGNENCVNLLYTDYSSTYKHINTDGITQILTNVEKQNPDITIAMLHWGSEYNDTLADSQTKICKLLSDLGVDAVIGSHPHYVQKMGFDEETGMFIAYSLGDFTGDATMTGTSYSILLDLTITKDGTTGETKVTGFDYVPIYLYYNDSGALQVLRIREAMVAYEGNNLERISDAVYTAMQSALTAIEKRVQG